MSFTTVEKITRKKTSNENTQWDTETLDTHGDSFMTETGFWANLNDYGTILSLCVIAILVNCK